MAKLPNFVTIIIATNRFGHSIKLMFLQVCNYLHIVQPGREQKKVLQYLYITLIKGGNKYKTIF